MIRMLLIGSCYSIRSELSLCDEVRFNLAYRWFCRLGLEAAVPHHATFSVNRHGRFRESAVFRLVFESVVATCMKVGLVGGEGFAGRHDRRDVQVAGRQTEAPGGSPTRSWGLADVPVPSC
jgi:transposase